MERETEVCGPFMTVVVANEELQEKVTMLAEENGFTVDAPKEDVTWEGEQILTLLGEYTTLQLFAESLRGMEGLGKIELYDGVSF